MKQHDNNAIDFVILWVNGGDPAWQKSKMKHQGVDVSQAAIDDTIERYRDWDNLQYLLRGIETFTPWVRKVHLVTAGHVPSWLNLTYKKLNHVKHEDYIPKEYLPTFNSHTIELNLHHIKGLADQFVLFNDDIFITKPMQPTDFFVDNLPCDQATLNRIASVKYDDVFPHILLNNLGVINQNFTKNAVIRRHYKKWFSPVYGLSFLLRSALLLPYKDFSGFSFYHMPSPFLKQTFRDVWENESQILATTSSHKFRHIQDINQYVMKIWQLASGNFYPTNIQKISRVFSHFPSEMVDLNMAIRRQTYKMICINDTEDCANFEEVKAEVIDSFETILPRMSHFERHNNE
jgi:hypothetical protein